MAMQERQDLSLFSHFLRKERTRGTEWETVANEYVHYLRYWDTVEGRKREVTDFDLAPPEREGAIQYIRDGIDNPPTKRERTRILNGLQDFHERLSVVKIPRNTREAQQLEFLRAKVKANIAHAQRKLGTPLDGLTYIAETMGIEPEMFGDSDLDAQLEVAKTIFESMGYEYSKEGIERYRSERSVSDDKVAARLKDNSAKQIQALSNFIDIKIEPKYEIVIVKEDKYWLNWADGNREGFKLKTNIHRRHKGKWTEGKTQEMPSHEIAVHFGQMSAWLDEIRKGNLHPALGLTSVHDPEQVAQEGLAQTLPYFVPEIRSQFSNEAEFELEITGLRSMVYNNVHYIVNSSEYSVDQIIDYVRKYLPAESDEEVKKQIKDRTENPVNQAYLYAYGIGFVNHRRYAHALSIQGRKEFLRFLFSQPTTPAQEERFLNSLLTESRNKSTPDRHN